MSLAPSSVPTLEPSLSLPPTLTTTSGERLCGDMSKTEYIEAITNIISEVSSLDSLSDETSPQSRALDWMLFDDKYQVCPDVGSAPPCDHVIQRYVAALFYFSTNGDKWNQCGRDGTLCSPETSTWMNDPIDTIHSDSQWLSNTDECLWGGLACRKDNFCIDRIQFGECHDAIML